MKQRQQQGTKFLEGIPVQVLIAQLRLRSLERLLRIGVIKRATHRRDVNVLRIGVISYA